jgi:hypothetical protein
MVLSICIVTIKLFSHYLSSDMYYFSEFLYDIALFTVYSVTAILGEKRGDEMRTLNSHKMITVCLIMTSEGPKCSSWRI